MQEKENDCPEVSEKDRSADRPFKLEKLPIASLCVYAGVVIYYMTQTGLIEMSLFIVLFHALVLLAVARLTWQFAESPKAKKTNLAIFITSLIAAAIFPSALKEAWKNRSAPSEITKVKEQSDQESYQKINPQINPKMNPEALSSETAASAEKKINPEAIQLAFDQAVQAFETREKTLIKQWKNAVNAMQTRPEALYANVNDEQQRQQSQTILLDSKQHIEAYRAFLFGLTFEYKNHFGELLKEPIARDYVIQSGRSYQKRIPGLRQTMKLQLALVAARESWLNYLIEHADEWRTSEESQPTRIQFKDAAREKHFDQINDRIKELKMKLAINHELNALKTES